MRRSRAVHAASIVEMERPLFGQLVRQVVRLSTQDLEKCLHLHEQEGGRLGLGQILLREGLVSREQICKVLRMQARWTVTALQGDMGLRGLPARAFLSLCLPAYNEAANIEDTLDAACAILPEFVQRFEVVVVDDGSWDTTAEVVEQYAAREPRVRLIRHSHNQGYGAAVTSGLRAAHGDLIMFTDSDGQFSLLDLPYLLARLESADVVVGYRYRRADPGHRLFNAWAWNRLIRLLFGVKVRDLDCAFKIFRREVIERLQMTATGAAINAEILVQCVRGGLRIAEVPVAHYPRCHGAPTGAALRVILRAFRELPQLWKYRRQASLLANADTQAANVAETPWTHPRSSCQVPLVHAPKAKPQR